MGSPVRAPGRQFNLRAPQNSLSRWPAKLATQRLSLPSTATPQGTVSPPPVKGEVPTGCPLGASCVIEAGAVEPGGMMVGQGRLRTREFAIQAWPRLSIATPIGASMPPPPKGEPGIGEPSGARTTTRLFALLVIQARPWASIARSKGFSRPTLGKFLTRVGSPPT